MDPPKGPGSSTQWSLRIPLVNAVKRLVFLTKRWGRRQIFDKFKGKDKSSSDRTTDKIPTAKILLLGAADSGKSTILKQMRMKYNDSFSSSEIEAYRRLAFDNVIQGMRLLLASLPSLGLNLPDALRPAGKLLTAATDLRHDAPFPAAFSDAITALWNHSTVQEARRRGRETALQNLPYLYTNLSRFFSPSFIPTHRDILHLHERTIGTTETTLIVNGIDTLVVDVGGAISERRKWIDAFADLTVIIHTVSLTGYSRFLVEDPCRNQMQDSLLIWDSICNAAWFRRIPIILCFTKNDLFEQEIQHSNVANWFPDFQATPGDAAARRDFFLFEEEIQHSDVANWFRGFQAAPGDTAAGRDYFINRFLALVKTGRRVLDEDLYIRVITATDADAETMKEVLDLAEGMYYRIGCTSKQGCNTEVINGPSGLR